MSPSFFSLLPFCQASFTLWIGPIFMKSVCKTMAEDTHAHTHAYIHTHLQTYLHTYMHSLQDQKSSFQKQKAHSWEVLEENNQLTWLQFWYCFPELINLPNETFQPLYIQNSSKRERRKHGFDSIKQTLCFASSNLSVLGSLEGAGGRWTRTELAKDTYF